MKRTSLELLRRFCTAYYDEWVVGVLGGVGGPSLSAGLCRSLEAGVGEAELAEFLAEALAEGKIKIIEDYKTGEWETPAWVITDYM